MTRNEHRNSPRASLALAFFLCLTVWFVPDGAGAQDLNWRGEWNRSGPWHGAATAVIGGAALGTELFWEEPNEPNWTGPALLDDGTRTALMANHEAGLERASLVSDVLVGSLIAMPLVVDPAVAFFAHDSPDVAGQMALISMESMAVSFLTVNVLKRVVARQRPPFGACYTDPNASEACQDRANVSFPSGHSATAWVGAGLV
ncbi:MAG: phosphatase PAP2 family protein, partial [Myxococcota bacterium]